MHYIYLILFIPYISFAINPSQPVVRLDNGSIVERKQSIPLRYKDQSGITVNYAGAGADRWIADGWRQASITYVTNIVSSNIPPSIQAVAAAYKASLEGIYGDGAATNRAITREFVAIDLSLRSPSEVSADTGLRLQTWFEILNTYWKRGEVWTFPYGEPSYSVTNVTEVWEAVAP